MQSGKSKSNNWIIEFFTEDNGVNPLMGWETSKDTMSEVKLKFATLELAINFAKKNKIDYEVIKSKKSKFVKKSYADNFLK